MKQKTTNIIILLLLIIITSLLFSFPKDVIETINYSISIWKDNILPSLFPFFIISELLINYGFINIINKITRKIMSSVFHLSGPAAFITIISMLGGFPSSAKYINDLLNKKLINEEEASFLLGICHFPNPLFMITTVGYLFLNNKSYGLLILISIISSNLILAIFTKPNKSNINVIVNKQEPFIKVLSNSIFNTFKTLILLLGIITIFLIVSNLIKLTFNLSETEYAIISGILEMSGGIKNISVLNIPLSYKLLLINIIISIGGFSIHMQLFSILENKKIKYKKYLITRIIATIISCTLLIIFYSIWQYLQF